MLLLNYAATFLSSHCCLCCCGEHLQIFHSFRAFILCVYLHLMDASLVFVLTFNIDSNKYCSIKAYMEHYLVLLQNQRQLLKNS